jgi:hypothetical protein
MKKMNRRPIEIEPGTVGYEQLDCVGFNRALDAWAKRRGIVWGNPSAAASPSLNRKERPRHAHPHSKTRIWVHPVMSRLA